MEFYYADPAGQAVGPVTQQHLEALLENGTLNAESLVAIVGETEWKPLGTLFQIDKLTVEEVPAQPAYAPAPYEAPQPVYAPEPVVTSYPKRQPAPRSVVAAGTGLPSETLHVFRGSIAWAYIASVYWWLTALAFFGAAIFLVFGGFQLPRGLAGGGLALVIMALVVAVFGGLFALPAMQCWAFGSHLSSLQSSPAYLENACERQAAFFRTLGIYVILMFCAFLAIIFFAMFLGSSVRSSRDMSAPAPFSQRSIP